MKNVLRLVFLVGAIAFAQGHSHLLASGACLCWTDTYIDGYQYGPPDTFVGSYGPDFTNLGATGSQFQCADACQIWVNGVGHSVCGGLGITDSGYVIEHWKWQYAGEDPPPNGHLDQQYDCNDI